MFLSPGGQLETFRLPGVEHVSQPTMKSYEMKEERQVIGAVLLLRALAWRSVWV